jgi:hypothetical protein
MYSEFYGFYYTTSYLKMIVLFTSIPKVETSDNLHYGWLDGNEISSSRFFIDKDFCEYGFSIFLRIGFLCIITSDYKYIIESYKNLFM